MKRINIQLIFDLPITFVIEDNNLSTNSPTNIVWGRKKFNKNLFSKSNLL